MVTGFKHGQPELADEMLGAAQDHGERVERVDVKLVRYAAGGISHPMPTDRICRVIEREREFGVFQQVQRR